MPQPQPVDVTAGCYPKGGGLYAGRARVLSTHLDAPTTSEDASDPDPWVIVRRTKSERANLEDGLIIGMPVWCTGHVPLDQQ